MPESPPATGATPEPGATPGAEQTPAAEAGTTQDPAAQELGDAGKQALSDMRLELKKVTRERDELSKAQQEREDAERTELERVTRERDDYQQRIATLEHEGRARQAATEAGIPDLWDRLKGHTPEDLAQDAAAMAERLGVRQGPAPDLGSGARTPAKATGNAGMNERLRRAVNR